METDKCRCYRGQRRTACWLSTGIPSGGTVTQVIGITRRSHVDYPAVRLELDAGGGAQAVVQLGSKPSGGRKAGVQSRREPVGNAIEVGVPCRLLLAAVVPLVALAHENIVP
jgi:hypothetical protein